MTETLFSHLETPVGRLLLAGDGAALRLVAFPAGRNPSEPEPGWRRSDAAFEEARRQLMAYFGGELRRFELPLGLSGAPFHERVWRALADIPFGETRSYGEIARALGKPTASRAVGAANGANPLPIILPCHRVIGQNGALTGFGGGLPIKAFLLKLEQDALGAQPSLF